MSDDLEQFSLIQENEKLRELNLKLTAQAGVLSTKIDGLKGCLDEIVVMGEKMHAVSYDESKKISREDLLVATGYMFGVAIRALDSLK